MGKTEQVLVLFLHWIIYWNTALGVSAVVQWVKNQTAATRVAALAPQVPSSAQHSELRDPALPEVWQWCQLQLGFSPWPRNFHMLWDRPQKIYISLDITLVKCLWISIIINGTHKIWALLFITMTISLLILFIFLLTTFLSSFFFFKSTPMALDTSEKNANISMY